MKPADCNPGTVVFYQPSVGAGRPKYRGVIRSNPWQLGHGTWVVHLSDMEPAYGRDTGRPERTTVAAAAVEHLELIPFPEALQRPQELQPHHYSDPLGPIWLSKEARHMAGKALEYLADAKGSLEAAADFLDSDTQKPMRYSSTATRQLAEQVAERMRAVERLLAESKE